MIASLIAIFFVACGGGGSSDASNGSGSVSLYMTDAPFLGDNVKEVNITVKSVEYRTESGWHRVERFSEKMINLLDLRDGKRIKLADFEVPTGHYTEIRFLLDAPEQGKPTHGNPGCFLVFEDGTTQPLFVPSGAQSGFKAKGDFVIVDNNGTIEVTADFDIQRSIVKAGASGLYLLKPVIHITVNELSGTIEGIITNATDYSGALAMYAYRHGTYDPDESVPDNDGVRFLGAVASSDVNMSDGTFSLHYLAEGTYDLLVTHYQEDGNFSSVLGLKEGVAIKKSETTHVSIDTGELDQNGGTGTLSLSLTDAPFLGNDVKGVFITIIDIAYHHNGRWVSAPDFNGTESIDLLELQNGKSIHLSDIVMPAGHYTQIRFKLSPTEGRGADRHNPGCYILFDDNTTQNLFVPSGAQSGYKAVGEFNITADSRVEVTADFDVHKSIVKAGNSGKYILKPTIRLIVSERSGEINGTVTNIEDFNASQEALVLYAYKDGTYDGNETIADENGSRFTNSYASADVNMTNGTYTIGYMGEGTYDLVVVHYEDGNYSGVLGSKENVSVSNGETTTVDIDTTRLSQP
ncbi:DUF4382 domain-containing protein [Hydrogenimonas sp.]